LLSFVLSSSSCIFVLFYLLYRFSPLSLLSTGIQYFSPRRVLTMSADHQPDSGTLPSDGTHFQIAQAGATSAFQGELQQRQATYVPAQPEPFTAPVAPVRAETLSDPNHPISHHGSAAYHHATAWHQASHHSLYHAPEHQTSHHPLYHSPEHHVTYSAHLASRNGSQNGHSGFYSHKPLAESEHGHLEVPRLHNYYAGESAHQSLQQIGTDLVGRIVRTVGANEGAITNITRNDNGHGISVGIRQWNQGSGELPELFSAMHARDSQKFNGIFGSYASHLGRESWVRNADLSGNHDFLRRLETALHDPEFQKVQIDLARDFAQKSIQTAKQYGLQTEQGAALVADITNQLGEGGARRVFAEAGLRPGGTVHNELLALQRMEHFTHRPNSRDRFNVIASNFHGGVLIHPPSSGHDYMA